jgi:hypothetical protein
MKEQSLIMFARQLARVAVAVSISAAILAANPPHEPAYNLTELGTLGGTMSYGTGINDAEQVVGYSTWMDSPQNATIWNGTTQDFLSYGNIHGGGANGINAVGQVVGLAFHITSVSVEWNGATPTVLLNLAGSERKCYLPNDIANFQSQMRGQLVLPDQPCKYTDYRQAGNTLCTR